MNKRQKTVLVAGCLVAGAGLGWRFFARVRALPCPPWLEGLLENPYMDAVAGSETLLDRLALRPGMKLLDVGCGPGRLTVPAAARVGPTGEVVALDLQAEMLRRLQQRLDKAGAENVRIVHAGIGTGKLPENQFDRALLVTVLGEIPDREAALAEIYAALKAGGILSVTEVIPDPHYQRRATVRRLARNAGFVEQASFGNALAFTLNFARPAS